MKIFLFILIILSRFTLSYAQAFLDVKDVRPGMKGYGLSVFSGWEPEKFGVEIIDIIKNSNPGGDIILARLSGPEVEKNGVVAGMSGSPVYIGDKLIGAVAYTWAFTKEPLCGITPIKEIISEKDHKGPPAAMGTAGPGTSGAVNFKKISTPLLLNGFTGSGEETVRKIFDNYFVMDTGDSVRNSGSASGPAELKAGDSVAVNLVDGDYNVEGIGTVTYVSNDDVYIFGHPMDLAGKVSIPISRSYIYTVVPSSYFSFKLGTSSEPLGAVVYDGQNGVYCRRGKDFDMVPVSMDVITAGLSHHYNFRVANSRYYFPALCSGALSSAMLNHTGYLDDKTINLKYDIDVEYMGRLYRAQNTLKYSFNPAYLSVYGMISDLNLLFAAFYDNNIGGIKLKGMRIGIDITEGLDYYIVDNLTVDRNKYYPGDTIRARVLLKKYGSLYEQKDFDIKVPEGTRPGQYWLIAGSEPYFYGEAGRLFPKYYAVNNIEDLIREMDQKQDITKLAAGITFASQGVMVNDKRLEKFPLNYRFLFGFNKPWDRANQMLFPGWIMDESPVEKAVFGLLKISVNIEEKQSINPE